MKVFRAILTILGCALIVLGGYSAVTFLMQRDFAPVQEPTVEAPQPAEPEQPEETPEEPTQPAEDPELEARHSRAQEILRDMSLEEKIYQLMFVRPEAITGVDQVTVAGQTTQDSLGRCPVGGLVYRADNLESEDQAKQQLIWRTAGRLPRSWAYSTTAARPPRWQAIWQAKRWIPLRPSATPAAAGRQNSWVRTWARRWPIIILM